VSDSDNFQPVDFGRYRLEERLAVGGMAEIFRAKSFGLHGFEKTIVIKRILPRLSADEEFVELFIDEARVMTELTHPKIVQVYDFGEVDGQLFIAMEYVEGMDLLELLRLCAKRRVRPTTAIATHIIAEVLDALDFAHGLQGKEGNPLHVVHSDVSPSNIFVSTQGEVKLGDFGIARARGSHSRSESGALRGKYGYMSPEQVAGAAVDGRADVFAAGIVLAELLMIRRLFIASNDLEVLLQVRDARLDRLYKFGKRIPPDLLVVLESALARDANLRYQSAGTFRDALHRYLFDNRRMVRGADVRRFIDRLGDTSRPLSVGLESPTEPAESLPPGVDAKPLLELDQELSTPPVRSAPTRDAPNEVQRVLQEAKTPAGLKPSVAARTVPRKRLHSIGRKRPIPLVPPPAPPPVPQGLSHTGEEPRLSTHHALAAVPELGSGSSSNIEFRTPAELPPEGTPPALQVDRQVIEPESVAASRMTTPIAGVPAMAAPDGKGDLAQVSLFNLIFRLAVDEATGLLILRCEDVVKEIYFVDGHPHYVSSNQAEELFGQYLVNKGFISPGELSMALAMLPHFGGKLGDALVALKLMRPMQVLRHLTQQVRDKLLAAFDWTVGTYMFYRDKESANQSAPLGLDAYEMLGAGAQRVPLEFVRAHLAPRRQNRLRAVAQPPVPPEVFRLGGAPASGLRQAGGQANARRVDRSFR
jgi:serine/threonine protein kinase